MSRLVHGKGINDADYVVQPVIDGKQVQCPYYLKWKSMIARAYSSNFHKTNPTYKDVIVCENWLSFSNFKSWMEQQDWKGKQLDKDLIKGECNIYSPENCIFIPLNVNTFIAPDRKGSKTLTGTSFKKEKLGKYESMIRNPFTNKYEYLGLFDKELDAHLAWKLRKHELSCELANTQSDKRVIFALKTRYL